MLIAVVVFGIAVFCLTLWASLTVARMRHIPAWRRYLPLTLFAVAAAASLLRAIDIPQIANAIAFPLNLAALLLSLREIRQQRHTTHTEQRPGATA
ncbi:hypothetical protein ACIRPX_43180 [Streptomyces sp. NPDC101225]|uniref:hypothetical protein n=1 Tax=Streptomyces sp. NPDC101225 TaxID=3366135 RepID=UPI00381213A1